MYCTRLGLTRAGNRQRPKKDRILSTDFVFFSSLTAHNEHTHAHTLPHTATTTISTTAIEEHTHDGQIPFISSRKTRARAWKTCVPLAKYVCQLYFGCLYFTHSFTHANCMGSIKPTASTLTHQVVLFLPSESIYSTLPLFCPACYLLHPYNSIHQPVHLSCP